MPSTKHAPAAPSRPQVENSSAAPSRDTLAQLVDDLTAFVAVEMGGVVAGDAVFGQHFLPTHVRRFHRRADDAAIQFNLPDCPRFPTWTTISPERAEAHLRHLRAWAARHMVIEKINLTGQVDADSCSHADDYSVVTWCGERFAFDGEIQRQAVRVLWADWVKTGGVGLRDATIGERIDHDSDRFRTANLFRGHPALDRMIRRRGRGTWALVVTGPTEGEW